VIISIYGAFIRAYLKYCIQFWAPKTGKAVINWSEFRREPLRCSEGWSICLVSRGWRCLAYSIGRSDGLVGERGRGFSAFPNAYREVTEQLEPGSSQQCIAGG